MSKYFTILTSVGEAKLANATALGETVKFTELALGDGNGSLPTPTQSQTSLINEVRRKALNSVSVDDDNPNWVTCEQVIPADVGGWTIREVGIYDDDGDLIAVGNFPETYKPILEEGSGRTQTIRVVLQISSTSTVELKIDPSVVLATREYVDDQDKKLLSSVEAYADQEIKVHEAASNPHPQYTTKTELNDVVSSLQCAKYDSERVYSLGETCWTRKDGDYQVWEWYSNIESLAGKSPLDEANRQIGWNDDTKPFYWTPAKKARAGSPLFPWMSMSFPEGTLNVIGNSVPSAVFWRLAKAHPEFVNEATGMIDYPENRGEFFRVLDQGRGKDEGREFASWQKPSLMAGDVATNTNQATLNGISQYFKDYGLESYDVTLDNYPYVRASYGDGSLADIGQASLAYTKAIRPSNLAFPILVEI